MCTLRPESTGTIRLKSKDPKEHPLIDANYLAERKDLDTLIKGVKMGREIFAQSGLDPYRADEFQPGAAVNTRSCGLLGVASWKSAALSLVSCRVDTRPPGLRSYPRSAFVVSWVAIGVPSLYAVPVVVIPT